MKLECEKRGKYLLIRAAGRLDAAWADHFTDTLLLRIRRGEHYLVIDASGLQFLSSAGIRSLLRVYKELEAVRGRFSIVNPAEFVERTLTTSGFRIWMEKEPPADMPSAGTEDAQGIGAPDGIEYHALRKDAVLTVSMPADWRPWQAVEASGAKTIAFSRENFALGIASAAGTFEEARDRFGEFLAVAGNVVYQPPGENDPPDYLIAENRFVPRMQCIQAIDCHGQMAHLIRFAPGKEAAFHTVSGLMRGILERTGGNPAGFVVLGEIEGLVGATLIRSPGRIQETRKIGFPEIRDWLSYCGERSWARQQALMAGVVSAEAARLLPLAPASGISAHIHAAVFPYQPLQKGEIELEAAVRKFFSGPPPMAVMHLADDVRPVVGLGESALIRGACWFGPIKNPEVLS